MDAPTGAMFVFLNLRSASHISMTSGVGGSSWRGNDPSCDAFLSSSFARGSVTTIVEGSPEGPPVSPPRP